MPERQSQLENIREDAYVRAGRRGARQIRVMGGLAYHHKKPKVQARYLAHRHVEPNADDATERTTGAASVRQTEGQRSTVRQTEGQRSTMSATVMLRMREAEQRTETESHSNAALALHHLSTQVMVRERKLDLGSTAAANEISSDFAWLAVQGFREFRRVVRERVHPHANSRWLKLCYQALDAQHDGSIDFACFLLFAVREAIMRIDECPQSDQLQQACRWRARHNNLPTPLLHLPSSYLQSSSLHLPPSPFIPLCAHAGTANPRGRARLFRPIPHGARAGAPTREPANPLAKELRGAGGRDRLR